MITSSEPIDKSTIRAVRSVRDSDSESESDSGGESVEHCEVVGKRVVFELH